MNRNRAFHSAIGVALGITVFCSSALAQPRPITPPPKPANRPGMPPPKPAISPGVTLIGGSPPAFRPGPGIRPTMVGAAGVLTPSSPFLAYATFASWGQFGNASAAFYNGLLRTGFPGMGPYGSVGLTAYPFMARYGYGGYGGAGYGSPMMMGYGGTGYGYGSQMSAGSYGGGGAGSSSGAGMGGAPDSNATLATNTQARATPNVGGLSWPVGLQLLAEPGADDLRRRIEALVQQAGQGGSGAAVGRELDDDIKRLYGLLEKNKAERHTLSSADYDESERFLSELARSAQTMTGTGG